MSSLNCTGIEPNPDISGIGVRTAIYAQAVLTLIQPILAGLDGHISEDELTGLHELYLGILLPGCALLLSAIIQNKTFGLSVYHATIVLNLSWINNTSAMIFFQFALIAQIQMDAERDFRRKVGVMWALLYEPLTRLVVNLDKNPDSAKGAAARESNGGKSEEAEINSEILTTARTLAEGMRSALRTRLNNAEELDRSKDILEDVIQNLSAFLGAGKKPSELKLVVKATKERLQKTRLQKSLGIFDSHKGTRSKVMTVMEDWVKKIPGGETVMRLLERDWTMATLASAHLILFSAFGAWLWITIDHFGDCESFTKLTKLIIFVPIPVTSLALRVISIIIYIICLLPYINIAIFGGLELAVVAACQQLIARMRNSESSKISSREDPELQETSPHKSQKPTSLLSPSREVLPLFIGLTFLLQAFFIISTEWTIHINQHLLSQDSNSQESDWTFGQTLTIALIILPLLQVWKELRKLKVFENWLGKRED